MEYLFGSSNAFSDPLKRDFFSYRYKVFVEHLGWELDTPGHLEKDQFDQDDTLYVIARNDDEEIVGCARLLPTSSPYLLEEVFPQLLNGLAPPKTDEIWELSRFTSFDLKDSGSDRSSQFSAESTIELLTQTIACARAHGAKRMISVSPIGVERLLRKAGFKSHRAGPPMIIDGYPLVACWIEL